MKSKFLILIVFALFYQSSGCYSQTNNIEDMLWNQGITKKAWSFWDQGFILEPGEQITCPGSYQPHKFWKNLSDMTEADLVGNPYSGGDEYKDTFTQEPFDSYKKTNYSFQCVNLGYCPSSIISFTGINDESKIGFGYKYWDTNPTSKTDPLEFQFFNNSIGAGGTTNPHTIKEVGIVLQNWVVQESPLRGGNHCFRENYRVGDFSKIICSFALRLDAFTQSSRSTKDVSNSHYEGTEHDGYITADLRFGYFDRDTGKIKKLGLIGIIISNLCNPDTTPYPLPAGHQYYYDPYLMYYDLRDATYENVPTKNEIVFLDYRLLDPGLFTVSPGFTDFSIDYRGLLDYYSTPPDYEYSTEDAVIMGLDVYSSVRNSNIVFSVKDIKMRGEWSAACNKTKIVDTPITSGTKKIGVENQLVAMNTISNGATATYSSGNKIVFRQNFKAVRGSKLRAYIGPCTVSSNNRQSLSDDNSDEEDEVVYAKDVRKDSFKIFPNPSNGIFRVDLSQEYRMGSVEVKNLQGASLFKKQLNGSKSEEIDLSGFSEGIYFVQLQLDDNAYNTKILKQN